MTDMVEFYSRSAAGAALLAAMLTVTLKNFAAAVMATAFRGSVEAEGAERSAAAQPAGFYRRAGSVIEAAKRALAGLTSSGRSAFASEARRVSLAVTKTATDTGNESAMLFRASDLVQRLNVTTPLRRHLPEPALNSQNALFDGSACRPRTADDASDQMLKASRSAVGAPDAPHAAVPCRSG
jgi:hypothetical protein